MLKDLRSARKSAGRTLAELSEETGLDPSDINKWERGEKSMSESIAQRLARHLPGTDAKALAFSNKCLSFKRAQERGDRVGVLEAAKSIVRHVDGLQQDPELEEMLDRLVTKAVRFAQGSYDPETYADGFEAEGRHPITGVRVNKATETNVSDDSGDYPLAPEHRGAAPSLEDLEDDEAYGDVDDGRDIHGLRVRPLGEVD